MSIKRQGQQQQMEDPQTITDNNLRKAPHPQTISADATTQHGWSRWPRERDWHHRHYFSRQVGMSSSHISDLTEASTPPKSPTLIRRSGHHCNNNTTTSNSLSVTPKGNVRTKLPDTSLEDWKDIDDNMNVAATSACIRFNHKYNCGCKLLRIKGF